MSTCRKSRDHRALFSTEDPLTDSLRSFLPESPRWLLTRDQPEAALAILTKYHAEGDTDSPFVRAELAQIQTTLELERTNAARSTSWTHLVSTPGMRRRLIITVMLGLFTQWSGNTLISYYLGDLLKMVGMTDSVAVQRINVSIACWSLVCATVASLLVLRVRRRAMYLACTLSLLCCYAGWTVAMKFAQTAADAGTPNSSANVAVLFFIYAYSPCYNIGYNALTYSKCDRTCHLGFLSFVIAPARLCGHPANMRTKSVHGGGLAIFGAVSRHLCLPALRPPGGLLYDLRQSDRP